MKSLLRILRLSGCVFSVILFPSCSENTSPPPPIAVATASLPNGMVGTPYSQTVQASGGTGPYAWSVSSGALPHNLSLGASTSNAVTVFGTPDTGAENVAFTIEVTDAALQSASQPYSVSILLAADSVAFSPPPALGIDFAGQLMGSPSAPEAEMLTNNSTSALEINGIVIGGNNASDFTLAPDSTCGSSLAAGASCSINLVFTPEGSGPRAASLTFTDDSVGSPQAIAVNGIGLVSGTNATLSAPSLTFNSTSPQSVTLSG